MKDKKYLITSPDEKTWKFDRPVIFLGEFCTSYKNKKLWEQMDKVVAKPYGLDIELRKNNYLNNKIIKDSVLKEVSRILNCHHGIDYDQKLWSILIGDWLERIVDAVYNRFKTLEHCLEDNNISTISIKKINNFKLAPKTTLEAIEKFNDDDWNDQVFSIIVKKYFNNYKIDEYEVEESDGNKNKNTIINVAKEILAGGLRFTNKIKFKLFGRDTDALFITTYLPKKIEKEVQKKIGQYPIIWNLGYRMWVGQGEWSINLRERLILKTKINQGDKFINILFEILWYAFPSSFLEDFNELKKITEKLPWPKSPKFVFTSNNFDFDDVFKLYTVQAKYYHNSVYMIGCHGGGFWSYFQFPSNSEKVSDKYITWGWDHGEKQHKKGIIFTTICRSEKYNKKGGLLLIQYPLFNRVVTWDVYADHSRYFNSQKNFVNGLEKKIRNKTIIRLHTASIKRNWGECVRWIEFDENLKLDSGQTKLEKLIAKSRLIVYGYDSTGFAETMALNIPSIVYLQVGFDQLNPNSVEIYSLLIEEGVAFTSENEMAKKINDNWGGVEQWWRSDSVQRARKIFCEHYAKSSEDPVNELMSLIIN